MDQKVTMNKMEHFGLFKWIVKKGTACYQSRHFYSFCKSYQSVLKPKGDLALEPRCYLLTKKQDLCVM